MLSLFPLLSIRSGAAICALPIFGICATLIILIRVIPILSIKNAKAIRISDAKRGIVRLEGIASARKPLKSPAVGEDAIYYRTTLWHMFNYGEGGLFNERLFQEEKGADFTLEDESGRMKVEGSIPSLITNEKTRKYIFDCDGPRPKELSTLMRERLDSGFINISLTGAKGYFSLTENCIPDGKRVIVVGEVKEGVVKPIILTDGEFYHVESDIMTELVGWGFVAFFGITMTLAFAIIYSNTWWAA